MSDIAEILKFDTQESFEKHASSFGLSWKAKHWLHDSGALSHTFATQRNDDYLGVKRDIEKSGMVYSEEGFKQIAIPRIYH